MISKAIHRAQRAKVPMKMAERIVRASGGVYTEDAGMLPMLPKNLSPIDCEAKFKKGSKEYTGFSNFCIVDKSARL
jgi:hypothetical protein